MPPAKRRTARKTAAKKTTARKPAKRRVAKKTTARKPAKRRTVKKAAAKSRALDTALATWGDISFNYESTDTPDVVATPTLN